MTKLLCAATLPREAIVVQSLGALLASSGKGGPVFVVIIELRLQQFSTKGEGIGDSAL